MQKILLNYKNLTVIADPVTKFIFDNHENRVVGFLCQSGKEIKCKELILTTGTFLNGLIHIGKTQIPAGICVSPICIKPFKNVPVVKINSLHLISFPL